MLLRARSLRRLNGADVRDDAEKSGWGGKKAQFLRGVVFDLDAQGLEEFKVLLTDL